MVAKNKGTMSLKNGRDGVMGRKGKELGQFMMGWKTSRPLEAKDV